MFDLNTFTKVAIGITAIGVGMMVVDTMTPETGFTRTNINDGDTPPSFPYKPTFEWDCDWDSNHPMATANDEFFDW